MDINCIQEAKKVFDIEISELEKVKNKLDDRFEKTVNLIYGLKNNKVVVTGIGKSGLIGKNPGFHRNKCHICKCRRSIAWRFGNDK